MYEIKNSNYARIPFNKDLFFLFVYLKKQSSRDWLSKVPFSLSVCVCLFSLSFFEFFFLIFMDFFFSFYKQIFVVAVFLCFSLCFFVCV